jgi:hypothetical protein
MKRSTFILLFLNYRDVWIVELQDYVDPFLGVLLSVLRGNVSTSIWQSRGGSIAIPESTETVWIVELQ